MFSRSLHVAWSSPRVADERYPAIPAVHLLPVAWNPFQGGRRNAANCPSPSESPDDRHPKPNSRISIGLDFPPAIYVFEFVINDSASPDVVSEGLTPLDSVRFECDCEVMRVTSAPRRSWFCRGLGGTVCGQPGYATLGLQDSPRLSCRPRRRGVWNITPPLRPSGSAPECNQKRTRRLGRRRCRLQCAARGRA